jgi:hypothetical protein
MGKASADPFEPYDSFKEGKPDARAAGRALIAEGKAAG